MKKIYINTEGLQTRVVVVEDGILQEYLIERQDRSRIVGSIFKGRIKNLEASLQAAFVDIGVRKNAFLHYWDMLPASNEILDDDTDNSSSNPKQLPSREEEERKEAAERKRRKEEQRKRDKAQKKREEEQHKREEEQRIADLKARSFFTKIKDLFKGETEEEPEKKSNNQNSRNSDKHQQRGNDRRRDNNQNNRRNNNNNRNGRNTSKNQTRNKSSRNNSQYTVEDIPKLFTEESDVVVQVTKGPIGTKGARVTTNLSIPGRTLVLLPNSNHIGISKRISDRKERKRLRDIIRRFELPKNMGLICRTVGAGKSEEHFKQDIDMLLLYWQKAEEHMKSKRAPYCVYEEPALAERTIRDYLTEDVDEIITDCKETYEMVQSLAKNVGKDGQVVFRFYNEPDSMLSRFKLDKQIENIFSRRVNLPSGGYLIFDETEALVAVDVNTGKSKDGKDLPETIVNTNLEAVKEIARQMRLRNIGGLVVLDLIDMRSRKDQQMIYNTFRALLNNDRAKTKAYPISRLGLIEMTRQREHESLQSATFSTCPYCEGSGMVRSATSMSVLIQRRLQEALRSHDKDLKVRVTVHPSILERLRKEDAGLLREMEKQCGGELSFRADEELHMEEFKLLDLDSNKVISS